MTRTTADLVAPHMGALRRFAVAFEGSPDRAEACVAATLETLIDDHRVLRCDMAARKALLNLYFQCRGDGSFDAPPTLARAGDFATLRLMALEPRCRQAFLLGALEGFSDRDIAVIMNCGPEEARGLSLAAEDQLQAQLGTRIAFLARQKLRGLQIESLVEGLGREPLRTPLKLRDAARFLEREEPDLVIVDALPDCVRVAAALGRSAQAPAIAIAPEGGAVGVVRVWPFEAAPLAAAIDRALFFSPLRGVS